MATPIFVFGKQRSGTTWLGNLLSGHPRIAAVDHEAYFGIVESKFFSRIYNRYGDLRVKTNFIEFVEVVSALDYFRLAGATKEFLYSLDSRKYEEIFRAVMDRYAVERHCQFWVEKTPMHALWAEKLARFYRDAKFIAISRKVQSVVASSLSGKYQFGSRNRLLAILRTAQDWAYFSKVIERFSRRWRDRILVITYEELRADTEALLKRISAFLGIEYDPSMNRQRYAPNTSFRRDQDRSKALTGAEKVLIRLVANSSGVLPLSVMAGLDLLNQRAQGRLSLPDSSFRLFELPMMHQDADPELEQV
jgi:hypothetical protein